MADTIEYPLVTADEMAGEAWAAMGRRDWGAALRLWQRLRRDFPERTEGYVWPIQALWQAGQLDAAEQAAADAFARFPENPDVLAQYGWIATMRERWDEALRWWAAVRSRAPERIDGYLWAIRALWNLGRFDAAEAMAAEALVRFPANADVQAESAWIAVNRGAWDSALTRWRGVLAAEPGRREAHIGLIQAMRCTGRLAEAEAMAAERLRQSPDDADLLVEYVGTAADRADWPETAARLEAARAALQAAGLFERTRDAIEARRQGLSGGASAAVAADDEIDVKELMLSFESMGERCDFGGVQRSVGVEPLGLLRFAYAPLDPLIAALDERFEVIGTAEDTDFERYQDETILKMKKYGLYFHTFVSMSEMPTPEKQAAFRQQQLRRLVFLKRKLIGDLEEPQKICVYANDACAADDDARRLLAALRRYGPNSLLFVRPADAEHPEGTLRTLDDGLYVGCYPGMTDFVAGQQPPFALWRDLCERVYRLERSRSGPGPLSR
ncbi:MAG: tetratricopeptide repeat protein [Alphaproteobacteria bacterium]|nr:tetratricopeptide repeat protein [Alphaproteobacteria bacterium]